MNAESPSVPLSNAFEVDNARNMSARDIVTTFLPTPAFWRLLTTKNHIIIGARGSGKTALSKMLAHNHLSIFDDPAAKMIVAERRIIGTYVPTKMEWVSALRNKPWWGEQEAELFFQWRLNISCCARFIVTIRSLLNTYVSDAVQRARCEVAISTDIAAAWSDEEQNFTNLGDIERYLEETEYRMQGQVARKRVVGELRPGEIQAGIAFYTELFVPLRRAMAIVASKIELAKDVSWLLCLDEAEFLDEFHHRILNTHMRADSGNLFFKISTMPYHHKTTATNTSAALEVGQDFEYVYIDRDLMKFQPSGDDAGEAAALEILERRAKLGTRQLVRSDFEWFLGPSPLLDPVPADWKIGSDLMKRVQMYGSPELIRRAERLQGTRQFRDQIARKIRGALVVVDAVRSARGNDPLDIYCGWRLAIRCSDANPRRLIRIFNLLLLKATQGRAKGELAKISANNQTTILTQFSQSVLDRTWSQPAIGRHLFGLLSRVGNYLKTQMHEHPMNTDQISAFQVDEELAQADWDAIRAAVGIGLLFPGTTPTRGDPMPERQGVFHLAYVLAPHFRLLPRRGKSRRLQTILSASSAPVAPSGQIQPAQLGLKLDAKSD